MNNTAALANTALIRQYLQYNDSRSGARQPSQLQSAPDSPFATAVRVVRRWAHARHLDLKTASGLLSPYGWTILMCHFGQQVGLVPGPHDFFVGIHDKLSGDAKVQSLRSQPAHVQLLIDQPDYFSRQIQLHLHGSATESSEADGPNAKRKAGSESSSSPFRAASALDILMAFFKYDLSLPLLSDCSFQRYTVLRVPVLVVWCRYILCDFNPKTDVASLRFPPRDIYARELCCRTDASAWVCATYRWVLDCEYRAALCRGT